MFKFLFYIPTKVDNNIGAIVQVIKTFNYDYVG